MRALRLTAMLLVSGACASCGDDEPAPRRTDAPQAGDPSVVFVMGVPDLAEVVLVDAADMLLAPVVSYSGSVRMTLEPGTIVRVLEATNGSELARFDVGRSTPTAAVLTGFAVPKGKQRPPRLSVVPLAGLPPGTTRVVNALADDESVDITVEGETSAVASNGFADFTLTAESTVSVGTQGGVYPLARVVPQDVFVVFGTYRSDLTSGAFVRGVSIPTAPDAAAAVTVVPGERQFLSVVLDAVPSYGVETPTFEVPFNTISDAQFTPLFMKVGVGGALVFEETDNAPPQGTWVRVAAGLAGARPGETPPSIFTIDTGGMYATGGVYVVNAVADGAGPLGLIVDGTEVVTDVAYGMGKRIQGSLSVGGHAVKVLYDLDGDGEPEQPSAGNFNVSATTQVLFVVGTFGMADTHHLQILAFDRTPLGTLTPVAVP